MLLSNINIRKKLFILSSLPILGLLLVISISLLNLKEANDGVGRIYEDRVVPLEDLKIIADNYAVFVIDAVNKANAGIMTGSEALQGVKKARAEIDAKWKKYMSTTLTEEEASLAEEAEQLFVGANNSLDILEDALDGSGTSNLINQLNDFDGSLYKTIDPISEKITELISLQLRVAAEERKSVEIAYENQVFNLIAIGALLILALAVLSILIYRSIRQPLDTLNQTMHQVASQSDLTLFVPESGNDELAQMSVNFNTMLENQRTLISDISNAIHQLAAAADQMTGFSQQANEGINAQRLEVEQVATAMNEMVSTSQDVAKNAEQADTQAQSMREQAVEGNNVVGVAVSSANSLAQNVASVTARIRKVGDDSDNIGSIIEVINDIAEQTNLLALNAAIEAARAGDQGRGFAVVADEVRTLAQRTQKSTTEIRDAIESLQNGTRSAVSAMEQSQKEAEETGLRAAEAGTAFEDITVAVASITDMNTHIASASEEQSCVSEEIDRSLVSINNAVQTSADGSIQISAASEQLSQLATGLSAQIGRFKV